MAEPEQRSVASGSVELNVLTLGQPTAGPSIVMMHGLRDVAWGLLPVVEPLCGEYHVVLPELRGHGASEKPNIYTMEHFIADLIAVADALTEGQIVLVGHSLGGHLAARFAALFPERVAAVALIEGLGPPEHPDQADPVHQLNRYRERLLERINKPPSSRALRDYAHAAERLRANNPRMTEGLAATLARKATTTDDAGQLKWSFDSRANGVFAGINSNENALFWSQVNAPTLVISGDLAYEYWGPQMGAGEHFTGHYAPGEMVARAAIFPDAEHESFDGSGHMVHYDEPERLTASIRAFLHRKL